MLSVQLQGSLMTIALVSDVLADYLTHPLEDVDNWYAEEDGLLIQSLVLLMSWGPSQPG